MSNDAFPVTRGYCGVHGRVYDGRRCPACVLTKCKAALRQAVWEASQFLTPAEIHAYVEAVQREIESDEP